jgi:flagellar protein FliO/FliZ
MDILFGGLPIAARFFIAFLIVLALIVLIFWAIRRFTPMGLGVGSGRGRQPRLAVIDAAVVDARRRLVLIRRDNVEHLLLIGGPSDVVVEQNIVRGAPAALPRETPGPRSGLAEVMARASEPAIPTHEAPPRPAAEAVRPEPAARIEPVMPRGTELPSLRPEPSPRREPLTRVESGPQAPQPRAGDPGVRAPASTESQGRKPDIPVRPAPPITPTPRGAPEAPVSPQARPMPPASDAELTDMAQRLEAALRRSGPVPARIEPTLPKPTLVADTVHRAASAPFAAPDASRETSKQPAKPEAPRAQPPQAQQPETKPKSVLDSLEQEMASLLGRPVGKE